MVNKLNVYDMTSFDMIVLLALLLAVAAEPTDVLICYSLQLDQDLLWKDVRTKLGLTGLFRKVDGIDCGSHTPSVAYLMVRIGQSKNSPNCVFIVLFLMYA